MTTARTPWDDIRGGVAAATMTLVTAVSYAAVAGAPLGSALAPAAVLAGLIGATLGGAVAALWGSVPGQMFSPRASVAVVIAAAIATLDPRTLGSQGLVWLTACLLLAALLQWGFGALRLGGLIRLIPHPVTSGLAIGIAADMAWSQLPHWWPAGAAQAVPLAVGLVTVAAITWSQWRGWKGAALPMGVATGVLAHLALGAAWPADALPHLPALGWRALDLPHGALLSVWALAAALKDSVAIGHLPSLAGFALAIAFVNSVETLTSTVVLEDLAQKRFDANKALTAGALGSLVAVCAGGLPVAGSAATSVASVKAGARTRHAALVASGVLVVLALLAGPWLSLVPMAVVAGLMLSVAFALAQAPLRELLARPDTAAGSSNAPWARPAVVSADTALAALVCALVLASGIVGAVLGGVVAAALLLVMRMRRTLVRRRYDAGHAQALVHLDADFDVAMGSRIQIVEVAQPLFFATADAVVPVIDKLPRATRYAIVDLSHVGAIDGSAARVLARCGAALRLRGRRLVVVSGESALAFTAAGEAHTGCKVFASLSQALRFAARRYGQTPQAPAAAATAATTEEQAFVEAAGELAACVGSTSLRLAHRALPAGNGPARDRPPKIQRRLRLVRDPTQRATP